MKNETIEDEIKLIKLDLLNIQKDMNKRCKDLEINTDKIKQQLAYLYSHLELKIPIKRICMECDGKGTFYIPPMSDCGQSNICDSCRGNGFKYA